MRSAIPRTTSPPAVEGVDASPTAGEVVSEIGLMLVLHLAAAFGIVLTLAACGIG